MLSPNAKEYAINGLVITTTANLEYHFGLVRSLTALRKKLLSVWKPGQPIGLRYSYNHNDRHLSMLQFIITKPPLPPPPEEIDGSCNEGFYFAVQPPSELMKGLPRLLTKFVTAPNTVLHKLKAFIDKIDDRIDIAKKIGCKRIPKGTCKVMRRKWKEPRFCLAKCKGKNEVIRGRRGKCQCKEGHSYSKKKKRCRRISVKMCRKLGRKFQPSGGVCLERCRNLKKKISNNWKGKCKLSPELIV